MSRSRPVSRLLSDRHALFAPGLSNAFEMLRVSATIHERKLWRVIHLEPNLVTFEEEHGVFLERIKYTARSMHEAMRKRESVLGRHAGLLDWFVPIVAREEVLGVLVTGPFVSKRPASADILSRWRWLTGRQGHPADPEFAEYLSVTLSTLVLDGQHLAAFERFLSRFARIIAGDGNAEKLLTEAELLRDQIEEVRFVDRMWDAARSMVDERTGRSWSSVSRLSHLKSMGLARVADAVLVGLVVSRNRDSEPVDDRLRRDAFQRGCAELARSVGQVVSGQVGDHGVTFLSAMSGSNQRKEQRLLDLGERAAKLAGRHALQLHLGMSVGPVPRPLSEHYQMALAAAESALSHGVRVRHGASPGERRSPSLGELRSELAKLVDQSPAALPARFDRFLESVAFHCGYRLEPARAHLEAAFERIEEALRDNGAFDEKSFVDAYDALERASQEARTVSDLFGAYRRAVSDVSDATQHPVSAHRDRSLRRALVYIRRHYSEPLRLEQVARVAGFAPNYFSALFKKRERVTFDQFLHRVRVERAKELLTSTDLEARRVAELSGFATANYFARAFKRAVAMTPVEYRKSGRVER